MNEDFIRRQIGRFDPTAPIASATMPPSSWYTSTDIADWERQRIFQRAWHPVVRVAELEQPGAYRSGCIAGMPWVVVRDHSGTLRAFHNVCRHKGREVVTGSGIADLLVCGYHAWAYRLDGSLRKAPRVAGIENFDVDTMGLSALAVRVWGPWVWVNADAGATDLTDDVRELDALLERRSWTSLQFVSAKEWVIHCNWKVYVDNYLDGGYHIPHMHPSLDAQLDMSSYRTEIFDRFSVQTSASGAGSDELAVSAESRIGDGAIYAWMYPNFMINVYGPCMDTNHVLPLGHDKCRVVYEFYFADEVDDDFIEASIEQADVTQREDIEICESVQVGLGSPAYDFGRYAPRVEVGEYHFHRLLASDLAG